MKIRAFKVLLVLAVFFFTFIMDSEAGRQDGRGSRGIYSRDRGHSGSFSLDKGHDRRVYRGHYGGSYYRGRGYYRGPYRRHYSGTEFNLVLGTPLWSSWYYPFDYPYYSGYYPYYRFSPYVYTYPEPYVRVPSIPREHEYIQRAPDKSSSAPHGVWYYCPETEAYYPYTKECPEGWQEVPARPPSESGR